MGIEYRVSAPIGEYTDRDGNQKKKYIDMGVIVRTGKGGLMLKVEAVPVGWDGIAWCNEPKEKTETDREKNPKQPSQKGQVKQDVEYDDDSIPF